MNKAKIERMYTCPTCGYEEAVWLLKVDTMRSQLCENCYPMYSSRHSRIISFKLNHKAGRKGRTP